MTLNLIGQRFGKLVVLSLADHGGKHRRWLCQCDCGRTCTPQTTNLTKGSSTACGRCRKPTMGGLKHGGVRGGKMTPTYQSWKAMKERVKSRAHYAGVEIDPRWSSSFEAFLADMGDRPAGTTIDRIDGRKGYLKENCRWATPEQQTRNRRTTRRFTIGGRTMTIAEWAAEAGLSYGAAQHRLEKYGGLELPHAV